jgi:divalent metal cation (Fe/Co/Zn/Cd) transporter
MQFQSHGLRLSGWKAALIVLCVVLVALVAVFLGFFLLVAGLVGSAIAALIYSVRRRFGRTASSSHIDYATAPPASGIEQLAVREIQVDEVVVIRPEDRS